jgi:hypothetical protein
MASLPVMGLIGQAGKAVTEGLGTCAAVAY